MTSCDFCPSGCTDPTCEQCYPAKPQAALAWHRRGGIVVAQCGVLHAGIWADSFDWWVGTDPADQDKVDENAHAHGSASSEAEAMTRAEAAVRLLLARAAASLGLTLQRTFGGDR